MNTLSIFPLLAAWRAGVPTRICHSHSMADPAEGVRSLAKYALRPFSRHYATHLFSCSQKAGIWLYGSRASAEGRIHIQRNAIDTKRFAFSQVIREEMRASLGLGNALTLGHVGRFCYPKNHSFLLDIFASVRARRPDAVLLLVGEGETLEATRTRAKTLDIADGVRFLGTHQDVEKLYAAMDVFVMPSHYEGLPVVAVEAQAAGLPCLFSLGITSEAALTSTTRFLPLGDTDTWAQEALDMATQRESREAGAALVTGAGYDIFQEAEALSAFYLDHASGGERP